MSILKWEEFNEKKKSDDGLTAGQKKLPKALQDAILKKKGKTPKKDDDDKEEKEEKGKKGEKGEKDDDKDDKDDKKVGLTAGQKKLPQALQDAILKKQKKSAK
jgi:hypothetical protein